MPETYVQLPEFLIDALNLDRNICQVKTSINFVGNQVVTCPFHRGKQTINGCRTNELTTKYKGHSISGCPLRDQVTVSLHLLEKNFDIHLKD